MTFTIHEDKPNWGPFFKIVTGFSWIVILGVILGSLFSRSGQVAGFGMQVVTILFCGLVLLVLHVSMPRKYVISEKGLTIFMGTPFKFKIPFENVRSIVLGSKEDAFAGPGLRFVCSSENVVVINRIKGWDVIISPADGKAFISCFTKAMQGQGEKCDQPFG